MKVWVWDVDFFSKQMTTIELSKVLLKYKSPGNGPSIPGLYNIQVILYFSSTFKST